jgi:hypothetical protein
MIHLTLVWRDESREPLKQVVESALPEFGFLCLELTVDQLPPKVKHKTVMIPYDLIQSVELLELEEGETGYREDSTFREEPGKSPWFGAMGAADAKE